MSELRHFRFGCDEEKYTRVLRASRIFKDERSKLVHSLSDTPHGDVHVLLFGRDMSDQREWILERAHYRCEHVESGRRCRSQEGLQVHHLQGGTSGRCDCSANLECICIAHHRREHVQVQSGRVSPKGDDGAMEHGAKPGGSPVENFIEEQAYGDSNG